MEITTSAGVLVSVGTIPLTIPSSGELIVRVRALTPGTDMNSSGQITEGTLTTASVGIDGAVTICGGQLCGGGEEEDCEAFRKRYIERLAYQPRATMAWLQQKLLEFPCATRVCVREGSCCRCEPECGDCGCKNCGNRMEFYVFFDDAFPCGIPPSNIVEDITTWIFGEHQGYGEGQVEIGVCGKIVAPVPIYINIFVDIEGCPSSSQKQIIADQFRALFKRICPSKPLRTKQFELIIASIIGAEFIAQVRFEIVGYETQNPPYPRYLVYADSCGIEPECDVMPCLNEIEFTNPAGRQATC
jgi:hypothetical protein